MLPGTRGRSGNLPQDLTSFVGRQREVADIRRLLSTSRLVTLTGIGGVGKTRLALRAAGESRRAFDDRVWLVALGELGDPMLVADATAAALGLREVSSRPPLDMVVDYCAERDLLLVLDGCEHLVEAVAGLADALLRACPGVRILVASREQLGIPGEVTVRVPPLEVPDPDRLPPPGGIPRYPAMTLFAERAVAALPGFGLTEENTRAVARICQQLDGLPLPIELAAARLRALSPQQILQRLTDRYRLLTIGHRGAPPRQQTLRMCIDWSYELCTDRERELWAHLSVFAGGFELDAAEGVRAADPGPDDVLDVVAALVDKSILIREDHGEVVRYRLLETLRDYGLEKLRSSGELDALRRRHRDWYEQLVQRAEAEWIGPRQVQWIRRLDREQANVRDALDYCLSDPDEAESALRIAAAMYLSWLARGVLGEGRRWLDRALACQSESPTAARVAALYAGSVLAVMQGDVPGGTALSAQARTAAAAVGGEEWTALARSASGYVAIFAGDLPRAVLDLEAAVRTFGVTGNPLRRVASLLGLALASGLRGEGRRSLACHEEILAITDGRGESMFRAYSLCTLGLAVGQRGESARATALLEEGLRLTRMLDDPLTCATCLEALAWVAAERQDCERAAVLMGAADAVGEESGIKKLVIPGLVGYQKRRRKQARAALGPRVFAAAMERGRDLGLGDAVAYALDEFAPAQASESTSVLTKREREVADLVAQGLTNREIAQRLVIAQRTAEGHVEHILTKLGFATRAQIAAWVAAGASAREPDRGTGRG
ncbi:LuxR family transcriptional regulator [Rhodococcus spelaei]|uniref:LuxR family transcriptional regulator n=1 Tax=Rhodococcus spelaei TaxID=2546320 RepID=A0A541B0V6_9NOCA|nr:LuxR C-terminal-related transcriptional regulator [Rhodococcus spelaei]TQF65954.1 LuxR family transcriptional regulator [Rhodococcus spelaei]